MNRKSAGCGSFYFAQINLDLSLLYKLWCHQSTRKKKEKQFYTWNSNMTVVLFKYLEMNLHGPRFALRYVNVFFFSSWRVIKAVSREIKWGGRRIFMGWKSGILRISIERSENFCGWELHIYEKYVEDSFINSTHLWADHSFLILNLVAWIKSVSWIILGSR